MNLFSNIRFYILSVTILLSLIIYFTTKNTSDLIRIYALLSVTYLYFTLLATPLTRTFTFLPYRGLYVKARRALGVSAFYFGFLHGNLAFFKSLGGLEGFMNLSGKYFYAVLAGEIAMFILLFMTLTANDFMIDKLGFKRWKFLHRLVYLASLLLLFHALTLGSHFQSFSGFIPKIFLVALIFLLILEGVRFFKYLKTKITAP